MAKMKEYIVKRTVVESFRVAATSKKEALEKAQDPFEIRVKSEWVTLAKT